MNSFAEGRYDVTNASGAQIQADYEEKRTDAWSQIEDLNITKRIISTCTLDSHPSSSSLTIFQFFTTSEIRASQSRRWRQFVDCRFFHRSFT
jgi:hypothetical protein